MHRATRFSPKFFKVCNIDQRGVAHRGIFSFFSQSSDLISMTAAK